MLGTLWLASLGEPVVYPTFFIQKRRPAVLLYTRAIVCGVVGVPSLDASGVHALH
jgi:hypothetical protein